MKIALYIGNHAKDSWSARAGWWIIRLVQRGPFKRVTHCEAILAGDKSTCQIASASLRDGGVRIKDVTLTPEHWLIYDVPSFDGRRAKSWFFDQAGAPYSVFGAVASVFTFLPYSGQFCSRAVAESVGIVGASDMTPQELAELCATFGTDITEEFFT
jgi:hypothetical protein